MTVSAPSAGPQHGESHGLVPLTASPSAIPAKPPVYGASRLLDIELEMVSGTPGLLAWPYGHNGGIALWDGCPGAMGAHLACLGPHLTPTWPSEVQSILTFHGFLSVNSLSHYKFIGNLQISTWGFGASCGCSRHDSTFESPSVHVPS